MLGIALLLLFVSAATCSSIISNNYIPLSAPLPNGTMALQCQLQQLPAKPCLGFGNCCSNDEILGIAVSPCWYFGEDDERWAILQYNLNQQRALCRFDGHSAISVQLLLTPNASAILDGINRLDEQLRQQQAIYRALQIIGGHIGLPILLLFSIFSKTAQRDLTFLNLCFTWIFSSITFSLGLYRLGPASSISGIHLPFIHSEQECLNQAALVSGAQAMTDTAMCALIVQLWLDFRAAIHGPRSPRQIQWTRATLLAAPYMALLAFSLPALGASINLGPATRLFAWQTNYYCMLFDEPTLPTSRYAFLIAQYTVLLAILIVTVIFDVCTIRILHRHWRFFRRTGDNGLQISLSVAFRVVTFCAYRLVAAVAYLATMLNTLGITVISGHSRVWDDMLQAATPLIAFLIFGTSKEFLDALMFWRWFNALLASAMCCPRRSPVTPREANACGEVVDHESVVSGDSVLDIKQEKKSTDECLPL
ncbi:hypothetical protein JB92DRAFT_3097706 [Gautieria morchelliformis]|nr:hypothetical protein JB92DRAFT_3097706 [Gautieria morchelliformis]